MKTDIPRTGVVVAALVVAFFHCSTGKCTDERTNGNELEPTNSDITWRAGYGGLMPEISTRGEAFVTNMTKRPLGDVLEMLDDPNRFAFAHVVLALRYLDEWEGNAGSWNGLSVDVRPNGCSYVFSESGSLKIFWKQKLKIR